MRIAQLAPLWETVPPRSYGGIELVVYLLTEELHRLGHEVTLFAPGGSHTTAQLEIVSKGPLRDLIHEFPQYQEQCNLSLYPGSAVSMYYELQLLNTIFAQTSRFDIIHNHLGYPALPFANLSSTPVLTTLHGAFKEDTLPNAIEKSFFNAYRHLPYISISDAQRTPCPHLAYIATVYHGLDAHQYDPSFSYEDKNYLAFLGRFCYDKGPHEAIAAAEATGWKLILAGKVHCEEEKTYFQREIAPHLDGDQIRYVGELNHPQKVRLLRNAAATLCPILWPEPFGLVLTESMACGTPVLAYRNGSVPELIRHGQTGFILENREELIEAIGRIHQIDRRLCR